MLPDNVKFPVLSHRHSPNPPHHKPRPVCGRWSQMVDPLWRVGKIPPSSTHRIPTRWILVCDVSDFGAIWSACEGGIRGGICGNFYNHCVVCVVPCNYLYQYLEMFRRRHGSDATVLALLVCELNRTPVVMAKHGGSCVHFSGIFTCWRTSWETGSHPQHPLLLSLYKISFPSTLLRQINGYNLWQQLGKIHWCYLFRCWKFNDV